MKVLILIPLRVISFDHVPECAPGAEYPFATYVENSFKNLSRLNSRGVKQAGFLVLRETTMPSVLIETGFLSTIPTKTT